MSEPVLVAFEATVAKLSDGWRSFALNIGDTTIYRCDKRGEEMWHPYISPNLEGFRTLRDQMWRELPFGTGVFGFVGRIETNPDKIRLMSFHERPL